MEKPKKYEDLLMSAFHFEEQDLEANQAGKFTDWQRNRLRGDSRRSSALLALFAFGGLFLAGLMTLIWSSAPNEAMSRLVVPLIMIAVTSLILVFYWARSRRTAADLNAPVVSVVEGRVLLKASDGQFGDYAARIGDVEFALKPQEFFAFKNGDPYRVYYTSRSKRILSLEWLRDADDNLLPGAAFDDWIADQPDDESLSPATRAHRQRQTPR